MFLFKINKLISLGHIPTLISYFFAKNSRISAVSFKACSTVLVIWTVASSNT